MSMQEQPQHYGEDASLEAAVGKIMGKITDVDVNVNGPIREEKRTQSRSVNDETDNEIRPGERNGERDVTDIDGSTDLDEAEAAERQGKGDETDSAAQGREGANKGDQFIELPPETEGGEAEKIPLAQAVEAIRAQRQIQGGVAEAINKAEEEYSAKQEEVLGTMLQTLETVATRAEAALKMIPTPRRPDPSLRNPDSPNYNPERYLAWQEDYEAQTRALNEYSNIAKNARAEEGKIQQAILLQQSEREYARLSRHKGFEEWSDPVKRDAHEGEMLGKLEKLYGVKADELAGVRTHKLFIMARDLLAFKEAAAKAPEVRKAVQERAPKITRTQAMPARDPNSGRFQNEARQRLRESGSEDAFAELLLKSGAL